MATAGVVYNDYLAPQNVRTELQKQLVNSGVDLNVLIKEVESAGLIEVGSVEASSAAVDRELSREEKASQLTTQVMKAMEADENGKKASQFIPLLEDNSLIDIAALLMTILAYNQQYTLRGSDKYSGTCEDDDTEEEHQWDDEWDELAEKHKQMEIVTAEKRVIEYKSKEKERELEQKESEIEELYKQLKKHFDEKIDLTCQLKDQEKLFKKKRVDLIKEKCKLEIKIKEINKKEEKLKGKLMKLEYKAAITDVHELVEKIELRDVEHHNSVTDIEATISELTKQNSERKPDTS